MSESSKEQLVIQPLEGYHPQIGWAMWMLEDARARTKRALRNLNPAHLDVANEEGGHTIGTLLYHIAAIEMDWLYVEVLEKGRFHEIWDEEFPYEVRDENGKLTLVTGLSWENHWNRLDKVRSHMLETFKDMTIEDFHRPRICDDYDVSPDWVLHHLCQHEAEHRGELIALRQYAEKQQ